MNRPATRPLALCLLGVLACEPDPGSASTRVPGEAERTQIAGAESTSTRAAALIDEFLEGYLASSPVAATELGDHRFDSQWPDLSANARARERTRAIELHRRLENFDRTALDPDARLDLDLVQAQLELGELVAERERPWERNPLAYAYLIATGLDDLISRDFAPVNDRAHSLAARVEALPGLIEQALANLGADPATILAPQAKVAVGQFAGIRSLIEKEIPARISEADPALVTRVAGASGPALAALSKLETKVRDEYLPVAKGEWRLGKADFARKLELTLQTGVTADELYARAVSEHRAVRARMVELARELGTAMYGASKTEALEKRSPDTLVKRVLAELAADHPTPDTLRDSAAANLDRLAKFVRDQKLVPTDEAEVLEVIWTPEHARGVAIAGLSPPGPLEPTGQSLSSFYLVQPVPDSWPAARRESFLREYNSFMLEILSIHEAIPGHFVQLYHGKREPSRVRRVLQNGSFIEGWAVYTEAVMVNAGYSGAGPAPEAKRPRGTSKALWKVKTDPALRAKAIAIHGQKFYLRTVTNAILDQEIHTGDMDEQAAVALMVDQSHQEEGEARAKWVRAQLSSTQLSTYFAGATAWHDLRANAEARASDRGERLDVQAFHAEALAHGSPPLSRLPTLMGW